METVFKVHADVLKRARARSSARPSSGSTPDAFSSNRTKTLLTGWSWRVRASTPTADALLFASLYPGAPPASAEKARTVFLARQDDARSLCWAAVLSSKAAGRDELVLKSAEGGCAWAQTQRAKQLRSGRLAVLEKAVVQGEPRALFKRASYAWDGSYGARDRERGEKLWLQAALLGHAESQYYYGTSVCAENSVERYVWLQRAAVQYPVLFKMLAQYHAPQQVAVFDNGGSGRILYEIGTAVVVMKREEKVWTSL